MDNLIERLEYGRDHDSNMLVSCVDEAIAALRAQWISVEDELPSASTQYVLMYTPKGTTFQMVSNFEHRLSDHATHWMPLPTPPETEHEQ